MVLPYADLKVIYFFFVEKQDKLEAFRKTNVLKLEGILFPLTSHFQGLSWLLTFLSLQARLPWNKESL